MVKKKKNENKRTELNEVDDHDKPRKPYHTIRFFSPGLYDS